MFKEGYEKPCKCKNRSFKFIFMDLQMPEMDGYEASEKILQMTSEEGEADYCHIVALTAFTSKEVVERIL